MAKETVQQEATRLVAELDALARTVDVEAAMQNVSDLGMNEPDGVDPEEGLAWLREVRAMVFKSYGV